MKKACLGFILTLILSFLYWSPSIGAYLSKDKLNDILGTLSFSVILFLLSRLLYKKKASLTSVVNYIIVSIFVFVFFMVGGSGTINDAYKRLEVFREYESNSKLEDLQHKKSMLKIDLEQFNNSKEFEDYINDSENMLYAAESAIYALIFALIFEFLFAFKDLKFFKKKRTKKPLKDKKT